MSAFYKFASKNFVYLGHDHGKKFLITGANGQIGRGLSKALYQRYGMSNVILTDISQPKEKFEGVFHKLDVTNKDNFKEIIKESKVTNIIHLASLLSTSCEKNLELALKVNIDGLHNALTLAQESNVQIFIPSSIATFGPNLEKKPVPDEVIQDPITFYGISKVYLEKLGTYFYRKFNTDFRSLRYPSIISPYEFDFNGSATYPTEMMHAAFNHQSYKMGLDPDRTLPFMYISDCIRSTIEVIEAGNSNLSRRVYNVHGLSFSPQEYIKELRKAIKFEVTYEIDKLKNEITKTWPVGVDDSLAKKEWGWKPQIATIKKLVNTLVSDVAEMNKS